MLGKELHPEEQRKLINYVKKNPDDVELKGSEEFYGVVEVVDDDEDDEKNGEEAEDYDSESDKKKYVAVEGLVGTGVRVMYVKSSIDDKLPYYRVYHTRNEALTDESDDDWY